MFSSQVEKMEDGVLEPPPLGLKRWKMEELGQEKNSTKPTGFQYNIDWISFRTAERVPLASTAG